VWLVQNGFEFGKLGAPSKLAILRHWNPVDHFSALDANPFRETMTEDLGATPAHKIVEPLEGDAYDSRRN